MKNIIVVADKELATYARKLVHSISKTPEIKASFFSTEQYQVNEAQVSGNNYVIFIGENDISKDYIKLIKFKYDKYGTKWGYDYHKAVIYVSNSEFNFNEIRRQYYYLKDGIRHNASKIIYLPTLLMDLSISKLFPKSYNKKLKRIQYETAINAFYSEINGFAAFIDEK